jgi:hypothetical protein
MMRWARAIVMALILCGGLAWLQCGQVVGQTNSNTSTSLGVAGDERWQKEFDELCSRTQDAMSYSQEQLAALVQRCDALMPQLEKLEETRKKVYLKRLKTCRGLYAYVLESKKSEKN